MLVPPPPSPRDLLLPLLACLPTAFISSRPPPSLLPLLSPILRQRLTYIATTPGKENWLSLLSWDAKRAAKLPAIVEGMDLEPHPVSGELELEELRPAKYRRLDEETLHSRLEVDQFDLLPIYVWCESDEHGGSQEPGWKLTELRALEDIDDGSQWANSPEEANNAAVTTLGMASSTGRPSLKPDHHAESSNGLPLHKDTPATPDARPKSTQPSQADQEDDSYWAAYDMQASETPALESAPAPNNKPQSDNDYYSRYATEVQPAMDAHDPDEAHPDLVGTSTLSGRTFLPSDTPHHENARPDSLEPQRFESPLIPSYARDAQARLAADASSEPHRLITGLNDDHDAAALSMPRPISPASSHSSVDRLEAAASAMAGADRAHDAIRTHIGADLRGLFRLAKGAGMAKEEFGRIVRRELEGLGEAE